MCSSSYHIIPPPKQHTLDELINGMKRLNNNIKRVLLPDKPKRIRDLSEYTFKDMPYKKTMLTQIEKVKKKTLWDKIWEE